MTKLQDSQAGSISSTRERRLHPRCKLTGMAYVELTTDNGGILLNLGEDGLAVQCALIVTAKEFPGLRFQLPKMRGWLNAAGRVAWISESKKEAGIAFVGLDEHVRAQISAWVSKESSELPASEENSESGLRPTTAQAGGPTSDLPQKATPRNSRLQTNLPQSNLPQTGPSQASVVMAAEHADRGAEHQNFRFNDYSMFGPGIDPADLWTQPVKRKRSWGTLATLAVLVAAAFFVLGARVQQADLNRLLVYVGARDSDTGDGTQQQTPASSPAQSGQPQASKAEDRAAPQANQAGSDAASDQVNNNKSGESKDSSQSTQRSEGQPAQNSEAEQNSDSPQNVQRSENKQAGQNAAEVPRSEPQSQKGARQEVAENNGSENGAAAGSSGAGVGSSPERLATRTKTEIPGEPTSRAKVLSRDVVPSTPASNPATTAAPTPSDNGHYILVNAPAPGSPPFFVNLPGEAVSASSTVAITARRSIRVEARAADYYGPERVSIGKLLAHSDPFYPTEARNRHIDGIVELRAVVGRTGEVISVVPVSGPALLVNAAATALHEWRYEPTYINGDPVETRADITMVFRWY